jgi:hypothetical protein
MTCWHWVKSFVSGQLRTLIDRLAIEREIEMKSFETFSRIIDLHRFVVAIGNTTENWKHLKWLPKSNIYSISVTNWLREILKSLHPNWVCALHEADKHVRHEKKLSVWGIIRRVREYTRPWCSKTCEYRVERCSIGRVGWKKIHDEWNVVESLPLTGSRLMFRNSISSVSFLRLGHLGFTQVFLLAKLS